MKKNKNKLLKTQKTEKTTLQMIKPSEQEVKSDFFSVCKNNVEKYFESMESTIPKYYQAFNELHQEYIVFCEEIWKTLIKFQKELTRNFNLNLEPSNMISHTIDATIYSRQIRDETIISTVESFKNIIRDWNDNFRSYTDSYEKIFPFRK